MKYQILPIIIMLMSVLNVSGFSDEFRLGSEYEKHSFTASDGIKMPYRLLTPDKQTAGEKYPLVVFLHGYGERGDDNESQLAHGASVFSNPLNMEKFPAYVLFPQCKEKFWVNAVDEKCFMPGSATPEISKQETALMELIERTADQYAVDKDRIYIVGISMGAIAVYDLVCRFPETFAAAIPICGAVNPDRLTEADNVNFRIFHGADDEEVPCISSREAYKRLKSLGAEADYVEFSGTGHDCWHQAFNRDDFLEWLFRQHKND